MNRIKILLVSVLAVAVLSPIALLVPSVAYAEPAAGGATPAPYDINKALCNGANNTLADANCVANDNSAQTTVQNVVNKVINIFSWVVGIVSVIMIIYGGFRYITSGGDSAGVTSAKNTILFAIVGLVIVALAQLIVKFVIGSISNVTDTGNGNTPTQ